MEHLGGAQPLHDLQARHRLPSVEHVGGQHLGGGNGQTQAGEIGALCLRRLDERGIERRQAEEYARPIAGDGLEDCRRFGLPRQKDAGGADAERKGDGVAEPVGKEDLGNGETHIALAELQPMARVGDVRVGHVVLQMHDALRPSGRSRGIHPERHVVAMRVGRSDLRMPREPFGSGARRHRARCCGIAIDHHQGVSRVPLHATALNRSTKAASAMATVAPESAR